MDSDSDRSSEATQLEDNSSADEKKYNDDYDDDDGGGGEAFGAVSEDEDDDDDEDDETEDRRGFRASELSIVPIEEDSRTCQSETLVSDLAEVPIKYEMRQDELERLKNQLQGSHQEALANVIAQAAQTQSVNRIKLPGGPSSSSKLSPTLATPISSLPSLTPISSLRSLNSQGQLQSPAVNAASTRVAETGLTNTSDPKPLSTSRSVKTPIDGYNWRKYGQKQVKSPEGSRSYYKCTYAECDAKKMESCDQYNSVIKIVYKGQHQHDPPKKVFPRGGKILSASKALKRKTISTLALKEHRSSGYVGNGPIQIEQMDAPQPKQRAKKSISASPGSVLKPTKKPKFVVHAAGDTEISADGYKWRKYGQKMVKGNPHPRNYYKCTTAGCPVRKHTEMAVDASEVIITYKGTHDHDIPVPKKGQSPPTGLLLTATSSATAQSKKTEASLTHVSATEPSNGVGEKKTNEPARTLLSVGFKIQPC